MFSTENLDASPMRQVRSGNEAGGVEEEQAVTFEPPSCHAGVQMLRSARFAHSDLYINDVAAMHRFECVKCQDIIVRTEATEPLPGRIFVLRKPVDS